MMLVAFLAIIGFTLVFLEFFLPGMIFALVGCASLVGSIAIFFLTHSTVWIILYILCVLLILLAICKTALWWIQKTKGKDQFFLGNNQEGYVASQFDQTAVGKQGTAFTELKPSGHVLVEGKQQQALCESGYAAPGTIVMVVGGKGGYLLVREIINN